MVQRRLCTVIALQFGETKQYREDVVQKRLQVDVAENECSHKVTREDDIVVEMLVVGLKENGEEVLS